MRSGGPKPKPAHIKVLEGNPGKRPIPKEPTPPSIKPTPPPWLNTVALEEWHRVIDDLFVMGLISVIDQNTFAAYCDSYSQWKKYTLAIQKIEAEKNELAALLVGTKAGSITQNPLIGMANKAKADMNRYAENFCLTPLSRARMGIEELKARPDNKFKGLIGIAGGKK